MRIALVTPEFQSLVHRTNLAAVAESLAKSLHDAGQELAVFLPWTRDVQTDRLGELTERAAFPVADGPSTRLFRVHEGQLGGVRVFLFENDRLFGRRHPYGDEEGPYPDNWRRFALFARAVLESVAHIGFPADIFHCLDWTTGMIPVYHELEYVEPGRDHPAARAGTYFAIHNLAMQGAFERAVLPKIGVPHRWFRHIEGIELAGRVNYLKAGAEFATVIGTHSPSHANRIQQQDRGFGLEDTFQRRKKELVGINNGIDYQAWDPATDPVLPANFDIKDKNLPGKRRCKAALQAAFKLDNGPRTPVAISLGRWDADSGFDLVAEVLTEILERNVELVVMGQGSPEITQRLQTMEGAFVGRARVVQGYDARAAHLMMAGADMLLLPSHYQPSNSLFAIGMRYGVLPLVYAQSGLEDVVVDVAADARRGTGFHFAPYSSSGLTEGLFGALKLYRDAAKWKTLVRRCMNQDFSWEATAANYLKAYRRVKRRVRARLESA